MRIYTSTARAKRIYTSKATVKATFTTTRRIHTCTATTQTIFTTATARTASRAARIKVNFLFHLSTVLEDQL